MADRRHWNKLRHFLSPFQWKKWSFLARPKLQIKRHNWSTANQTSKWCCLKDQKGTRGGGGRCLSEHRMADSRMIRSSYCLQWTLLLDGWRIKRCHFQKQNDTYFEDFVQIWNMSLTATNEMTHLRILWNSEMIEISDSHLTVKVSITLSCMKWNVRWLPG